MKIAMIGTGYVGLVTGACFADWGHDVICVDKHEAKIQALNHGKMPIYEPGLEQVVGDCVSQGRLRFVSDLAEAVPWANVIFIAVGTPQRKADDEMDVSQVYEVAEENARYLAGYAVIVVKSTVPVGTCEAVDRIIGKSRPIDSFSVVSNPEFLRKGSAIGDFQAPDRVVIGAEDQRGREAILDVYATLCTKKVPVLVTRRRTSELIKFASNALLATNITYVNEMADLCERLGANVDDLALGVGLDHRIGSSFLAPGPGYGGSCFPKDTHGLICIAQENGVALRIVEATIVANEARKHRMALKVIDAVGGSVDRQTIGVLGLSFKPETDDIRESPAIPLIESLQRHGAIVRVYDPVAMDQTRQALHQVTYCADPYDCARGCDAVVIVTDWNEFKRLNLARLKEVMKGDSVIDLRNIVPVAVAARYGLRVANLDHQAPRAVRLEPTEA
jgi:UDPglucose 6-dehydrogenase